MWTEEITNQLKEKVSNVKGEIPYKTCETLAGEFGCSVRAITGKLRSLGYQVGKKNIEKTKNYSAKEEELIKHMVTNGAFIEDIASKLGREVKQIRGKLLSMKLTAPTRNKKEAKQKTYTPEQEEQIKKMVESGAFIEDIAEALNKTVPQIRGKLLSMRLKAPLKNKKEKGTSKIYTDEVVNKVTELFNAGKNEEEIAAELGVAQRGLHRKLISLGLIERAEKPLFWNDETVAELERLFNETTDTIDVIAEKMNTTLPVIAKKLKELGYEYESRRPVKRKFEDE